MNTNPIGPPDPVVSPAEEGWDSDPISIRSDRGPLTRQTRCYNLLAEEVGYLQIAGAHIPDYRPSPSDNVKAVGKQSVEKQKS
ncbi:hypothetical protein J6590_071187 [Homalodisca vitripennis]|nr:hypothetical protein J6590_071187 [Homalodisca vitripennis]